MFCTQDFGKNHRNRVLNYDYYLTTFFNWSDYITERNWNIKDKYGRIRNKSVVSCLNYYTDIRRDRLSKTMIKSLRIVLPLVRYEQSTFQIQFKCVTAV
jgi:hypothetical protein